MRRIARVVVGSLLLTAVTGVAAPPPPVGATIEVREGDAYTTVKVVGSEGTKVKIRYDDGTEEWVGPDRIKTAAAGADAGAKAPAAKASIGIGDSVEIKRGGKWYAGRVTQVSPNWIFVVETEREREQRWAEPWAVRVAGAAYEIESEGSRSWDAKPGQLAPKTKPDAAPRFVGNRTVVADESRRLLTRDDLEKTYDTLSFDGSQSAATVDTPVKVPTTRPAAEFSAWAVRGSESRLTAVLPCVGNMKTAVCAYAGSWSKWSTVIRANLRARGQLDTRVLYVPDLDFLAAGDDGDTLLTQVGRSENVQWWKWDGKSYTLAANIRPDASKKVRNAALLPNDRVVVGLEKGGAILIDLAKKSVVCTIDTQGDAVVDVHPSGELVTAVAGGKATLLRATDFAILKEFDDAAGGSNVSVDPTGTAVAYLTDAGNVRVAKIADGEQLGVVSVGAAFRGRLDLVDTQFLIVNGRTAYDVKTGIPVWEYRSASEVEIRPLMSGQFLLAAPGDKMTSLAVASIPDSAGRAAIRTLNAGSFILKPGMAVKLEGDFAGFGEDQDKAASAVRDSITTAGLKLSDNDEAFRLVVTLAPGPTDQRKYVPDMFSPPNDRNPEAVSAPSNIFTATLNYKGQAVWQQIVRFQAGSTLMRTKDSSFQAAANEMAKPTAERLGHLSIPSFLPAGAKPGSSGALGASVLTGQRFVPEKPANDRSPKR